MNNALKRLGVYLLIYLFISQIITYKSHYAFASKEFYPKIKYLEQADIKHNTFFLGSSLTYRQIDPHLVDSIYYSHSTEKMKSFNLGIPGLETPTSFYLLKHLINSKVGKDTRCIFLELREIERMGNKFIHTQRGSYSKNFKDTWFVWKSNYHSHLPLIKQIKSVIYYSLAHIEDTLHFGHFGEQIMDKNFYSESTKNGFIPLILSKKEYIERHQHLLENPQIVEKLKNETLQFYTNQESPFDKIYYNKLMQLSQELREKNIELIFLLPPRRGSLFPLYKQLPEHSKIDLCNPLKYPEFYTFENLFDKRHLNKKGAELYSKALAEEFALLKNK